ncbi:MAG: HlyD family efflux transporter periplasmic adaptor subunit [Candidatus Woodwardiibium sp.]
MKQQAALPPGSPRDEGRPNTARNLFKQFGSAVAGLLVIAYIGLQLALNVGDFVEVENAMQAYVEAQTDVTAYIFREESAIYASAGGVCAYIAEDGEKVSRGQDVAAVYSQAGDASVQERIRELNEKIDILEQSQGFTSAGSTELTRLDASISDGILDVIRSLEAGDPAAAQRGDTELLVLMNRRRSLYLPAGSFALQIARYEEEIRALEASLGGRGSFVQAPFGGYFYDSADGYEGIFTPEALEDLTIDGFLALTESEPAPHDGAVGRISPESRWYVAFTLDKRQAAALTEGKGSSAAYTVSFPYANDLRVSFTHYKTVTRTDSDVAVLVLTTNELPTGFSFLRSQPAKLLTETYTGIRIPVAALRVVDGKTGVYTLDGNVVRFKETEVLYEDEGMYICEMPMLDGRPTVLKKQLSLYDAVVVSGRDLYEGKILN